MELRLHSPVGAEPVVYQWPLTTGRGSVSVYSDAKLFSSLKAKRILNAFNGRLTVFFR